MTTAGGTTAGGEESGDDRGGPGVAGGAAAQKVLLVTSSGASPHAVVPVLAAAEAAGLQVRAIDLGGAGAGGSSVTDRVLRALLGEGAERRLRKELEQNPPDVAVVFDPHSAQALRTGPPALRASRPSGSRRRRRCSSPGCARA
ncbi:MAG TPA: hypothetical protein PKU97_21555 [Kofleriaceae bacterium]|nr:hypothetical protein [Kofleriaceae bacterium]